MTTPEPPRGSDTGWPSDTTPVSTPAPVEPPAAVAPTPVPPTAVPPTPVPPADPAVEPATEPATLPDPVTQPDPLTPEPAQPVEAPVPAEPAAAEPTEPAAAPARSPWRSPAVLALALTTLLMAVATGFVWYQVHQKNATESARRAGLETSRDAARVLFSYDYRTLDKDFAAGKAITTGSFQKSYGDTTSKVVAPVAKDKKAVVKAEVVSAGVVRATPSTVTTVVFVNQVTTSSLATAPKVDLSRVRMTVKHVGGRWLISNVEAL